MVARGRGASSFLLCLSAVVCVLLIVLCLVPSGSDAASVLRGRSRTRPSLHRALHQLRARNNARIAAKSKTNANANANTNTNTATSYSYAYQWSTKYFEVPLDHFEVGSSETIQLKYLINTDSWDATAPGPIFFYTGNEGAIEDFANNTGFMWEIAAEFKAMIVFAEHRYYGTSLPYNTSVARDLNYYRQLSSEQALADYADLLVFLKAKYSAEAAHVISFGGSYGAMLAAWWRMHYPQLITGAIPSSAPMYLFPGINLVSPYAFNERVTLDYGAISEVCVNQIRSAWDYMSDRADTQAGREEIRTAMNYCSPLESYDDVVELAYTGVSALTYMAMVDYPYATTFMADLPASPVTVACNKFSADRAGELEVLASLGQAIGVWYNNSGQEESCFTYESGDDELLTPETTAAWEYQACTELILPSGQSGVSDFFWSSPYSEEESIADCKEWFADVTGTATTTSVDSLTFTKSTSSVDTLVTFSPRTLWVATFYAARDYSAFSNMFFTNGDLDPWSVAGLPSNLSLSAPLLSSIMESGAAHHLDLRAANPVDPAEVTHARILMRQAIHNWIGDGITLDTASIATTAKAPRDHRRSHAHAHLAHTHSTSSVQDRLSGVRTHHERKAKHIAQRRAAKLAAHSHTH